VPDVAQFLFINGTRAMTGNLSMGSQYINSLVTGGLGTDAVNKTYADTKASATIYGYVTLMAGSAMYTTTNPSNIDQAETTTNKNNYIYSEFTDGGSENAQWVFDMPGDWSSADATNGKITFNSLWTAASGSGTVEWDYAGKLFPDDAAIDTALTAVGTSTDTLTAVGDMEISPDSTAAVVTSAGTGGRTMILKVTRNSGADTLSSTARLIGVRIKYIRTLA
jgi:hypothetical protein